MATITLSDYAVSGASQILGYSADKKAYGLGNEYSNPEVAAVSLSGGQGVVSLSGSEDPNVTAVTTLNLGNTDSINGASWSIFGGEKDAHVTSITTGKGNDEISLVAINDGADISTGAGNDVVSIGNAVGSLTVNVGDGNDQVSLAAVNGALTVTAGDGDNNTTVDAANSTLSYNGGTGKDSVYINTIAGTADINLGDGANTVSVASASAGLTITGGEGVDSVNIGSVEGTAAVNVSGGNNLVSVESAEGSLTVTAGSGNDEVSIGKVGKDATFNLGDGKDSLTIATGVEGTLAISAEGNSANVVSLAGATYEGNVSITLGAGNDTLAIEAATVGGSISLGEGKDSVMLAGLEKATVTSGAGNKTVSIGSAEDASVTLGAGKDSVMLGAVTSSTIDLGEGNDTVSLGGALEDATLTLGTGNDMVSVLSAIKSGTINLGEGNDTLSVGGVGLGDVTIAGGAGKDSINLANATGGTATLVDFEAGTDTLYGTGAFAIGNFSSDGTVKVGAGGAAKAQLSGESFVLTIDDGNTVAWAGESGTTIDASSFNKAAILIGSDNDDASDTLIGGSKADSIFAGSGDYVYGGAGNDSISLGGTEAAYVGFSKSGGKDSVTGFTNNSNKQDVVVLYENSVNDLSKITVSGGNTTLKMGTATLTLNSTKEFRLRDNTGSDYKVSAVDGAGVVSSIDDMADVYYASDDSTKKSLSFSNVNDRLVVDLGNTGLFTNTNNALYVGKYSTVTGGKDDTVLMGAANNSETLTAGSGNATLWGGGSKSDTLVHSTSDKDNTVTFVYGSGDGKDTVSSSNWGGSDSNDVLWLNNASISSVKNNGTDTTLALSTAGDKLTISGLKDANTTLKYTTDGKTINKVKVGVSGKANNFNYEDGVSAYVGGTGNTLTVGSDVDTATIMLDNSAGTTYEGIKYVDAHNSSGDLIIGGSGSTNETLTAGKGSSSLWGGAGSSNDTLVGTTGGTAEYYFGYGDGKDVITTSHSDDKVVLYNVALTDGAKIDNSSSTKLVIQLNDGSTLTVNNISTTSVNTFQLTDSAWQYNASKKEWTQVG